jgi:Protein of unknown function (DUF664)
MSDDGTGVSYRTRVPDSGDERTLLEAMLDFHRGTFRWKCSGLPAEMLVRKAVPTSSLTLLGLVRHLAENEQWWFRRQAAQIALDDIYCTEEFPDGDFDLVEPATAEADLARLDAEIAASRDAVASLSVDHEFIGPGEAAVPMNLRFVYLHMIEEYSRHNGHADLLREAIDGATGE